jgi:hypothetical protein
MGRSGRYPSFIGTTHCYDFSPLILLRLVVLRVRSTASVALAKARKRRDIPGSWGASPVAYAAFSDPGRAFVPCLGGRPAGRCRRLSSAIARLPVPHSVPHVAVSPPRGTSVQSPLTLTTRTPAIRKISGLNHAASALAVYASQHASRRTTQDSLAAGGQPLLRGALTR